MSTPRILLINPTITSQRNARFPLAVLTLAQALDGDYETRILDGNVDRDFIATTMRVLREERHLAVGITVMGGPQLPTAIAVSREIRSAYPNLPIVWGGYFPTICPEQCLRAGYVSFVIRGPGEATLIDLLGRLRNGGEDLSSIDGLSWRREGELVHNTARRFVPTVVRDSLPYSRLRHPRQYLGRTYLGQRTAGYQAALGCRFRCTFCGVATMYRGKTALPTPERLERDLRFLTHELGADAMQFYDNNFFDRDVDMQPLLEVLAKFRLPWWCFARSDALLNMSSRSWQLTRQSGLRMTYIGAESPSDALLRDIRKGTRADQTLEVVDLCRSHGVIPELSFMLAPPHDPEGETERTFEFIRTIKRRHPATEIMIYIYTPLPPALDPSQVRSPRSQMPLLDAAGRNVEFPQTADEWSQPQWLDYWCHQDAPWLTPRLRQRIVDFTTVLGCRFPTVTDIRSPPWAKRALSAAAAWRYRFRRYEQPWELDLSKRFIRLRDPRASSL